MKRLAKEMSPQDRINQTEALRVRIAEILREIAEIESATVDGFTACKRLDAALDDWQARFRTDHVERLADLLMSPTYDVAEVRDRFRFGVEELAGALLRDGLRKQVVSVITSKQIPGAIPPAARSAKIADLEREQLAVELAEERLIREAEADGQVIPRRPDVRGEVVLGLVEDVA